MYSVEFLPEYKNCIDEFYSIIERLNITSQEYSSVENCVLGMTIAAEDLSFKKGFQEGVAFMASCISVGKGRTDLDSGKTLKQIEAREAILSELKQINVKLDMVKTRENNKK